MNNFKLFWTFAKIGTFTIGGGLAMLPIIRREVVTENKWIDDDEFMDMIALSQSLPGLIAVNIAIFVGQKVNGIKGCISATLGSILPSLFIILLIAMALDNFKEYPVVEAAFKGIRPVVIALLLVPTIQLAIKNKLKFLTGALALTTTVLVAFINISPITIIVIVAFIATLHNYIIYKGGWR
jgi:chromate transporter